MQLPKNIEMRGLALEKQVWMGFTLPRLDTDIHPAPQSMHGPPIHPHSTHPHDTPTKRTNGMKQRITKAINRNVETVSSARALKAGDTFSVKDIKVRACGGV